MASVTFESLKLPRDVAERLDLQRPGLALVFELEAMEPRLFALFDSGPEFNRLFDWVEQREEWHALLDAALCLMFGPDWRDGPALPPTAGL